MGFRTILILFSILIIIMFCQSIGYPFWDTLKSYGIMYLYDKEVIRNSYLNKKNIIFSIPDGTFTSEKDWYPFMLHYDASSDFSRYIGRELSCMILYSFGSFDFMKGSSNIYNPNSPYQGAFYGGYALFEHDSQNPPYGFDRNGKLNMKEIENMPLFDQTRLVLPSVGCPKNKIMFERTITSIDNNLPYIGMEGWTRINAIIKTNAPTHTFNSEKNIGYLQYGKPHTKFNSDKNYPLITLNGRIYVKYINELKGTFILYAMAKDQKTVDRCDELILSHTKIKKL